MAETLETSAELAAALRNGLRRLAKAVVVITCQYEGQRYAMAATAVSELSMEPPSMLVCVNRTASLFAPLSAGADFCVNILSRNHEDIAALCSGKVKGEERFNVGDWTLSDLGPPYLRDAQASFICRNDLTVGYGTHGVFVGVVEQVFVHPEVNPLVYADGRYGGLGV